MITSPWSKPSKSFCLAVQTSVSELPAAKSISGSALLWGATAAFADISCSATICRFFCTFSSKHFLQYGLITDLFDSESSVLHCAHLRSGTCDSATLARFWQASCISGEIPAAESSWACTPGAASMPDEEVWDPSAELACHGNTGLARNSKWQFQVHPATHKVSCTPASVSGASAGRR